MGRALVLVVVVLLLLPSAAWGEVGADSILDDVIPPAKQTTMGLHKLTPEEKQALRKHMLMLTQVALAVGRSEAKSQPAARMPAREPSLSSARQGGTPGRSDGGEGTPAGLVYSQTGGGHWIDKNIDRGCFIVLEDQSLWAISPLTRLDASLWLPISNVMVVRSNDGPVGYDYKLINTDDRRSVEAKYLGRK